MNTETFLYRRAILDYIASILENDFCRIDKTHFLFDEDHPNPCRGIITGNPYLRMDGIFVRIIDGFVIVEYPYRKGESIIKNILSNHTYIQKIKDGDFDEYIMVAINLADPECFNKIQNKVRGMAMVWPG